MNKLLSIIIPVYKVEPYINKCLDSLIVAPEIMEKMDVLIINDGTPDRSAEMSREYVKRFPGAFRQIDKENGGHGSVWNLGIKAAYGKYIKFLDSDDWLENVDVMIQKLEQTDADLIVTPCITHNPGNELWKLEIKDMEYDRVYDADRFDWLGNRSHRNYLFHHCAIYKAEMFRRYQPIFLEKQPYDDTILAAVPIIGAKSLVAWDLVVYHYLMDRVGQSISASVQLKNLRAMVKAHQQVIEFVEEHPISPIDSTKYAFFKTKMPLFYSFGHKSLLEILPYKEAKTYSHEWDDWAEERNPEISSRWIKLYRALPFPLYWVFYKSTIVTARFIKRIKG